MPGIVSKKKLPCIYDLLFFFWTAAVHGDTSIIITIIVIIIVKSYKFSKKTISHLTQIDLNHKTSKIRSWAYIFQRVFLVGLYLGLGGYNLVPRVRSLSDIELHRRPISERQETLRERLGGVIIGIYCWCILCNLDGVFLIKFLTFSILLFYLYIGNFFASIL